MWRSAVKVECTASLLSQAQNVAQLSLSSTRKLARTRMDEMTTSASAVQGRNLAPVGLHFDSISVWFPVLPRLLLPSAIDDALDPCSPHLFAGQVPNDARLAQHYPIMDCAICIVSPYPPSSIDATCVPSPACPKKSFSPRTNVEKDCEMLGN